MRTLTALIASTASAAALLLSTGATAQDAGGDVERRVDRIERELRAVQRRVFPGSESGIFTPEVTPVDPANPTAPATGASAIGDLSARIDAIEAQLARLTGEVEQQQFRQREIEAQLRQLRTDLDARAAAPAEAATTPASTPAPRPAATTPTPAPRPAATTPTPAPRPAATTPAPRPAATTPAPRATTTPAPTPAPAASATDRRARVAAIEVPSTGDAGEDAYLYGFRMWEARLYPEAATQLQRVIEQYPNHRRASYAGNLLGRAYLDNEQPSLAIQAFYANYRERPRGERAPDSVYYMGMALIRLNRREDACRTFDEFTRVYGESASQSLRDRVAQGRGQAGC